MILLFLKKVMRSCHSSRFHASSLLVLLYQLLIVDTKYDTKILHGQTVVGDINVVFVVLRQGWCVDLTG